MKRQFRQAYVEPTSEQDELLHWKRAHWEEAQIQSRPTRGYVNPSDVEKARLVWQEAQIPKSKPLTDPQAEKLGKALRSAVDWYQMAAEPRPPREKERLEKIKRTAEKLVRLLASSSKTRVRLKREFPRLVDIPSGVGAVSVIRKAAARALVTCDNTTGEKVSRRRAGAILEEKFGSPGRLFIRLRRGPLRKSNRQNSRGYLQRLQGNDRGAVRSIRAGVGAAIRRTGAGRRDDQRGRERPQVFERNALKSERGWPLSRSGDDGQEWAIATKPGWPQMTQSRNAAIAPIKRRALRINDAAAAYGVGRSTIYKLMSEGKLATVKVAGRRLVPCDNMEALLREGA